MLNEFRSTSITWDKATSRIYSPVTANASDENGRKLVVQIVNSGQVEDLTGATLHLYWETRDKAHDGLDVFKAVDLKKGEFELSYTTGMLSNKGVLNANLVLIDTVGRVVSERFKITVTEGIDNDAIQSENSFSSLTQALIDISNLEQNYAPRLNDLTAQLQKKVDKTATDLAINMFNEADRAVLQGMEPGHINAVLGVGNVNTYNIMDKAVTASKVDFMKTSTNLLNVSKYTRDKTIDPTTGEMIDNAGGNSVLPFFPVKPNTTYTDYRTNRRAYYDSSENYLGTSLGDVNGGSPTFTTPANTALMRMVVPTGYLPTAQLNEGSVKLPYEPYYVSILSETFPDKGITNEKLTNLQRLKVLNQGTIDFDFTNKLIKFENLSVLHGKSEVTINQNLNISTLSTTARHILFYDTATSLLSSTEMTALAIPETAIVLGVFRIGLNDVWGIDKFKINGVDRFVYELGLSTLNDSGQSEIHKKYPIKSNNLSPLASKAFVGGSPVDFDFLNNKISIQDARLVFGNRSEWISGVELSTDGLNVDSFYILYFDLLTSQLGAISQSYPTKYGTLNESTLILGIFNIGSQYVEGLTNYRINGKTYKIMSPDDVGKSDYAMLDTSISQVFSKNIVIPSQDTEIRASTVESIYAMYDALMAAYPKYITKTLLGNEATGLPIYRYDFKPVRSRTAQTEKKAKVILLSGTHPERTAVWTLYNSLKNICDNWKDDSILETLRFNVDFIVVPLVNPHSYNSGKRTNSNGVDINRNFPKNWEYADAVVGSHTYRGPEPLSEIESQLIYDLMMSERNNILGLIDFHNFDVPADNYYYLLGFPGNVFSSNIMSNLIQRMDRKWKKEYSFVNQDEGVFLGAIEPIIPGGLSTQAGALHIKGAITFEVDYKVFADPSSDYNDSITMTWGYEAFVNFLAMFIDELIKRQ